MKSKDLKKPSKIIQNIREEVAHELGFLQVVPKSESINLEPDAAQLQMIISEYHELYNA